MATRICLINQKGGCGKSSTCFHLAGYFAARGSRVLLIDADPQGSLSQGFFGSQAVEAMPQHETLAAVFQSNSFFEPATLVKPTPHEGIAIVAANQRLAPFNRPEPETLGMAQFSLDSFLGRLSDFDLVLIDCPPNLYACTWNALLASDFVLIPVPPEDFGTQGLRAVHQAIDSARALNPRLCLLGHLVTRYDRRLLVHRAYDEKLRTLYGPQVLNAVIPEAAAFKMSLACRKPVTAYSPCSKAAQSIEQLGEEIVSRIEGARSSLQVA